MIQLPFFVYQLRQASPAVVAKWKQQWPGLALSGFFLGVHFMSWVWSIDHTSLAHSLLWVSSHPLVVVGGMYLGYVFGRLKSCRLRCGELLDKADKPVPLETLGAVIGEWLSPTPPHDASSRTARVLPGFGRLPRRSSDGAGCSSQRHAGDH